MGDEHAVEVSGGVSAKSHFLMLGLTSVPNSIDEQLNRCNET